LAAAPSTAATKLLTAMSWNSGPAPTDEKQRMVYALLKMAESSVIVATSTYVTAIDNFVYEVNSIVGDDYLETEIRQVLQEVKDVV